MGNKSVQQAVSDRPRERLARLGPRALSTRELLALLINSGTVLRSADTIAGDLLERYGSLNTIAGCDVSELMLMPGMGNAKAATLCAALELATRLQAEPFTDQRSITSPELLARRMITRLRHLKREIFLVILLNTAHQIIREVSVGEGSLNAVVVHPREVFRLAIAEHAAAIILVHNHPSGNPEPSKEDLAITRHLTEAGRIVEIKVLDHIIIGGDTFTSFSDRNLL